MRTKRHTAEQIINKPRQAEVELAKSVKIAQVCRKLAVTEQAYDRWRKEYGGVRTDQAKGLKELEKENARLKKLLAESELDKAILREVSRLGQTSPPQFGSSWSTRTAEAPSSSRACPEGPRGV